MSDYQYGQVEWGDAKTGGNSEFMKLEQGHNVVRVFTLPYQFQVCWLKDASGANRKLRPALKDCPLAMRGEKIQTRWYVGAVNRKTNRAEILEIGQQILNQIKALADDPDWGKPINYDIDIVRGPKDSQPLYNVVSKPPKPLSEEDQALIKAFLETTDLEKMTVPPTAEEVAARLAEIEGRPAPSGGSNGASAPAGQQKQAAGAPIDDSTFNFDEGSGSSASL